MNEKRNFYPQAAPDVAFEAVLKPCTAELSELPKVTGYNFNCGIDYHEILKSYSTLGFQATHFGRAVDEIKKMISGRKNPLKPDEIDQDLTDPFISRKSPCTIFLGFTSNMSSSGVRETIRFLVEHKMVDCLVTSAGGIEEDLIKCLAPTYVGRFDLKGSELRKQGVNRIGNLLIPNGNYCLFEDWILPILDEMLLEQTEKGITWTPSKMISNLGKKINDPSSICYWAEKNKIPIFSPALTDGSIGDMLYFHSFRSPGLILDIVQDIRRINTMSVKSISSGMIILGGGLIKHHICNANLIRNGADFSVYINTSSEYDGSDSGASPDEAVSWGKIKATAHPVKITADASLVFPLLVAETFARWHHGLD